MGTTMRNHSLIVEGDRILVGLSGGKDSMILLEALMERRRAMPFDFALEAAHVEATGIGYQIDREKLDDFCRSLGVPLHHLSIQPELESDPESDPESKLDKYRSKTPCFICSWHRRKKLFELCGDKNFNKLALGHHRNDAIETLLMNMIYHGSISSLPYSLDMFGGKIKLIRPLMDMDERLLVQYAVLNDLVKVEKSCPHENLTRREDMRSLISKIEALHGPGPFNIFKSMDKIFEEYLPADPGSTSHL